MDVPNINGIVDSRTRASANIIKPFEDVVDFATPTSKGLPAGDTSRHAVEGASMWLVGITLRLYIKANAAAAVDDYIYQCRLVWGWWTMEDAGDLMTPVPDLFQITEGPQKAAAINHAVWPNYPNCENKQEERHRRGMYKILGNKNFAISDGAAADIGEVGARSRFMEIKFPGKKIEFDVDSGVHTNPRKFPSGKYQVPFLFLYCEANDVLNMYYEGRMFWKNT